VKKNTVRKPKQKITKDSAIANLKRLQKKYDSKFVAGVQKDLIILFDIIDNIGSKYAQTISRVYLWERNDDWEEIGDKLSDQWESDIIYVTDALSAVKHVRSFLDGVIDQLKEE